MGAWSGGRWTLALSVLVSVVAIAGGTLIAAPVAPPQPPLATRLASLHTDLIAVRRAPFCPAMRKVDVETALGGPVVKAESWRNGDTTDLDGDASTHDADVVDEFGCRWSSGHEQAAAWVYAPPVTVGVATGLVATARATKGCHPLAGAVAFGSPWVALTCLDGTSYRGLFGDAWLVCTTSNAAMAERLCAAVLLAAS